MIINNCWSEKNPKYVKWAEYATHNFVVSTRMTTKKTNKMRAFDCGKGTA